MPELTQQCRNCGMWFPLNEDYCPARGCKKPVRSCKIWINQNDLFDLFDPDPEMLNIPDIARALSNICRWGGRCNRFYSVAEHSYRLAERFLVRGSKKFVETLALARWALLHDAVESLIGDIPTPIKVQSMVSGMAVETLEEKILVVVATRFNLPWPMPNDVHQADVAIRDEERVVLFGEPPSGKGDYGWASQVAEQKFLYMATRLGFNVEAKK